MHLLTTGGLKPDLKRGKAIVEMPRPEGLDDILRFNGMVKVIPQYCTAAHPYCERFFASLARAN